MDGAAPPNHPRVRRECVTAENVNALFDKYGVPDDFDLLGIDIDGNDYWVWQAIHPRFRPAVVVMEYNASIPPSESRVMPYDPSFRWDRTDYFGASLLALARLARRKGYALVYCERCGVNAFFLREDVNPYVDRTVAAVYRQPDYLGARLFGLGRLYWPRGVGHKKDRRRVMVDVD